MITLPKGCCEESAAEIAEELAAYLERYLERGDNPVTICAGVVTLAGRLLVDVFGVEGAARHLREDADNLPGLIAEPPGAEEFDLGRILPRSH